MTAAAKDCKARPREVMLSCAVPCIVRRSGRSSRRRPDGRRHAVRRRPQSPPRIARRFEERRGTAPLAQRRRSAAARKLVHARADSGAAEDDPADALDVCTRASSTPAWKTRFGRPWSQGPNRPPALPVRWTRCLATGVGPKGRSRIGRIRPGRACAGWGFWNEGPAEVLVGPFEGDDPVRFAALYWGLDALPGVAARPEQPDFADAMRRISAGPRVS